MKAKGCAPVKSRTFEDKTTYRKAELVIAIFAPRQGAESLRSL
jgi:hypothetical protein